MWGSILSRIYVKNLPKYVAEDRLREFFSQKGELTDCLLIFLLHLVIFRTRDGKSRQFGFIGFHTEHEAEEALKYFNRSYLDTHRITCEVARKVGDPNIPPSWSRYSRKKDEKVAQDGKKHAENGSVAKKKGVGKNLKESIDIDDPQLQEFLQVTEPRSKSKMWANDTLAVLDNTSVKQKIAENKSKDISVPVDAEVVRSGSLDDGFSNNHISDKTNNLVYDDVISDMEYFKSRVTKKWSDSESSDDDEDDNNASSSDDDDKENDSHGSEGEEDCDNKYLKRAGRSGAQNLDPSDQKDISGEADDHEKAEVEDLSNRSGNNVPEQGGSLSCLEDEKGVLESCRLFVRNLPYTATEEELEEHFSKIGSVSQVHLVVDKDTKRSKGIAYILYTLPEFAARALEELDNSIFQGRLLHVLPAMQRSSDNKENHSSMDQNSKSLKQKREEERKAAEASGDTRAWNSLFMRPDTVVENIARKYGVSKSDLLDREADDLAVRIALGETQVIAETKKALTNAGVNVESLEEFANGNKDGVKRSKHVLLVKNLPYGSSENELAKMFGKFGSLDKIILPPTKTLALVVYLEPAEARAAFRGLAYKRFKDAPLYLEWAPSNILIHSSTSKNNEKSGPIGEKDVKRQMLEQQVEGISYMDIDHDRVEARSLYVKNLNFKTSDESLKNHFSEHVKEGRILSAKVNKHMRNGKHVSRGFGFIEFDSLETATNACRDLQGTVLDGHALILQLHNAKKDGQVPKTVEKDKSSTKLLVRNVAFEATKKDLRQLFSPFGQIKSLRLPMKFGSHRGFAFVEYVTKQEAQNALKALSSTHLYGRHLVIERAKEGESLEELRARTADQFSDEQNGFQNPTKLSKKRKHLAILDEGKMKFQRTAD
ncbi:multiple RNA-binding domain-containing protein 1 [Senna tora]|uniref:Multiple RNA-binding domain-containing protein 1 n=1 Tax=Senna tora TaxID=362788 RepID=A0A834SJY9_9FABA|nr:multiple RNA-binding domain-containing protein 1 [Senna tora]